MKKIKNFQTILLCLFLPGASLSLHAQTWKNYTCMKSVQALTVSNSTIWAATGGGVFSYTPSSGTIMQYNNSEGVPSNTLTAIVVDTAQRIWVGGSDGSIGVYAQNGGSWTTISDIKNIDPTIRPQKSIQDFFVSGDTMFVATQFGVSVFRISEWGFRDTYANFGFSSSPTVTRVAVQGGRIWVGTTSGIASASLTFPYLTASDQWTTYSLSHLFSSPSVTALAVYDNTVIVGTSSGAAAFIYNVFQPIRNLNGKNIVKFRVSEDKRSLYVLCAVSSGFEIDSLASLQSSVQTIASNSSLPVNDFVVSPGVYVGTSASGISKKNGVVWDTIVPNGPNSNTMTSLAVDPSGVLWVGTLPNGGGTGFYRFDLSRSETDRWKIFTSSMYPIMRLMHYNSIFDDYYRISIGANGTVWVSSWGDGVVEVVSDTIKRKYNYYSKPSLPGAKADNPTYVVTGGVAVDNEGNTWIANRDEYSSQSIVKLTGDSTALYFPNALNPSAAWFHDLVIDQYDTKWMANSVPSDIKEKNLYYLNEKDSLPGTFHGWGVLTNSDGLPGNAVLSLAMDLDGSLWVGTSLGAAIISDPSNPSGSISTAYALTGQMVQSIAVDAMNRKWVGTKEGAFLVSADGTELLQQYSVENTGGMLANDDVRSIALDPSRGIAYFGTENGLSSLTIGVVQTQTSYTKLKIFPNPYLIPNGNLLTIHNLTPNSTIKILTVSGILVTQFDAQGGGQAVWDGKNFRGAYVPSGIYIIVAFTQDNKAVAGKVAVIRH